MAARICFGLLGKKVRLSFETRDVRSILLCLAREE